MNLPRLWRRSLPLPQRNVTVSVVIRWPLLLFLQLLLLLLVLPTAIDGLSDNPGGRHATATATATATTTNSNDSSPCASPRNRVPTDEKGEQQLPTTMTTAPVPTATTVASGAADSNSNSNSDPNSDLESIQRIIDEPLPEMPLLPITSDSTVRACRAMTASPSRDVFVCSYPKSGTTWTQNIVVRLLWEIANNDDDDDNNHHQNNENDAHRRPLPDDWHLSHSAPFYEVDKYWRRPAENGGTDGGTSTGDDVVMERIPARTPIRRVDTGEEHQQQQQQQHDCEYRVFNTHLRPDQLPPNARCVYVVRDPFDVVISFYHHLSNQAVVDGGYTGTFDEFCNEFLDGTILYGKWQDHIEAWLQRGGGEERNSRSRRNFLLLHYEDMKNDLETETKRLARFLLEDTNENDDEASEEEDDCRLDALVSRVVPHCTFAAMKAERHRYTPLTVAWRIDPKTGKPYDQFVRRGNVGEGNEFLRKDSSSELRHRWVNHDAVIARARWNKAGVDAGIIDRYLS